MVTADMIHTGLGNLLWLLPSFNASSCSCGCQIIIVVYEFLSDSLQCLPIVSPLVAVVTATLPILSVCFSIKYKQFPQAQSATEFPEQGIASNRLPSSAMHDANYLLLVTLHHDRQTPYILYLIEVAMIHFSIFLIHPNHWPRMLLKTHYGSLVILRISLFNISNVNKKTFFSKTTTFLIPNPLAATLPYFIQRAIIDYHKHRQVAP